MVFLDPEKCSGPVAFLPARVYLPNRGNATRPERFFCQRNATGPERFSWVEETLLGQSVSLAGGNATGPERFLQPEKRSGPVAFPGVTKGG